MYDIDLHLSSQPATLRRIVEDKLRTAILWGRFVPGQRLVEQLRQGAGNDDGRAMMEAKARFYAVLTRGSRNGFVEKVLTMLHNRIMLLRLTTMRQPGRIEESIRKIGEIRDAVVARDPERAERACNKHIEQAAAVAIAVLAASSQSVTAVNHADP